MNELASDTEAAQPLTEGSHGVTGTEGIPEDTPIVNPELGMDTASSAEAVLQESFDNEKGTPSSGGAEANMEAVLNIPVVLSMELGRTRINIRDLLKLGEGSVVQLDRSAGDPLDILVNDCLVARGEVVVVNDRFGIRVTDILSPDERVRRIR